MVRPQTYRCPDCDGVFRYFHHPDNEPPPNFCPLCGSNMSDQPEFAFMPSAPHLAKSIGKTADRVYRQVEESSVANAEMVAEMTGESASDVATAMKVTNLADYLRPGDIAAKMANNEVAKHMRATGQGGFQPALGMTGQDYAKATGQGLFPHAGDAMRQDIASTHQQRAHVVQRLGQLGRHK
jgi:hypothetical protein